MEKHLPTPIVQITSFKLWTLQLDRIPDVDFKTGTNSKDRNLSDLDYQKQTQDYHGKTPVIILGSDASAAYDISRMGAPAKCPVAHTDVSDLSTVGLEIWKKLYQILDSGIDSEFTPHQVIATEELTSRVTKATWILIEYEGVEIFQRSLQDNEIFPLGRLLEHTLESSLKVPNIVTTDYNRLAEYACDQGCIHHYTGFTHGFLRQLTSPIEITFAHGASIWKVYESLDQFQSSLKDTVALLNNQGIPDSYQPQIATPGTQRYQKTHLEPFRSIINNTGQATNEANSYLYIGYGFSDEYIRSKLIVKCAQQKTPIATVTYTLSESAKNLVLDSKAQNCSAIERSEADGQPIAYSSSDENPLTVEKNTRSPKGCLSLIMQESRDADFQLQG